MQSKITKSLLITALSLFVFLFSNKDSLGQKFIIGYGLSVYTDMAIFSPESNSDLNIESDLGISILSVSAEMKYNLYEFNSDLAFSVASSPSIGIMINNNLGDNDNSGFGNLRIPVYAQLDYGNLSTFESMKNFGIGIGIGYQFDRYNLFGDAEGISVGTVATRLGIRYFNRNNKSREVALKVGLPKTITDTYNTVVFENGDAVEREIEIDTKITSFQLSWILYFNY